MRLAREDEVRTANVSGASRALGMDLCERPIREPAALVAPRKSDADRGDEDLEDVVDALELQACRCNDLIALHAHEDEFVIAEVL